MATLPELMASTSHIQASDSPDSTSDPTLWKVFISFRSKDTRNKFTDHLYNFLCKSGIKTYRDTPELRAGEKIAKALPQAIRESKIYVVVLSEHFADSYWCLDELVQIIDFCGKKKRTVLPVYYYTKSCVFEHHDEKHIQFFKKHETRYGKARLTGWSDAMKEVAKISGYPVADKISEAHIVNKIVDDIFLELNPKTLQAAEYPVGLDSRSEEISALLSSNPKRVNKFGIYGMGGVGKTTLAINLYNKNFHLFPGSSFLADVSKVSETDNGLVSLQQQLIDNVLRRKNDKINNLHHGIACIKDLLCSTKALVVIDDLEDPKQLKYLGELALGSIIIITTRNEDLLDSIKVEAKYKVNELSKVESSQLFARHAFGGDRIIIPEEFMELSSQILKRAGGLPFALQDFGDKLLNKSYDYWEFFIGELIQASITKVEKELQVSYDGLKSSYPVLQNIFLDIACFFMGLEKEEVAKILETCYKNVNNYIDILKKRSLVTIINGNKLGMHDLLRDMGRNISRNGNPNKPGEPSRLWESEVIRDVFKRNKGTKHIEGIIPHNLNYEESLEGVTFTVKTFRKMINLRFLYLEKGNISESFQQTFDALRWLRWESFPLPQLPSELRLQKLIILDLPHSDMTIMWTDPKDFKELKSLNLSNSLNLTTIPEFNRFKHLETLNLEGCKSLEEINIPSGSLQRLVFLNLCGCEKLSTLKTICELKLLKVLNISKCRTLKELPTELGNLESLEELNAEHLIVSKLPDSIGCLAKLVALRLTYNKKLETLPDTLCNLRSLENLDLGYCDHLLSISELPPCLKILRTNRCTSLERLPSLSNLKQVKILDLKYCIGMTGIEDLKELTSIRILHLTNCNSSLVACTLLEHFIQVFSEFGHQIRIYTTEIPNWISRSSNLDSNVVSVLLPNVSNNFLGIILCFKDCKSYAITYSSKNITSNLTWSNKSYITYHTSLMVIVPKSLICVKDGDNSIEVSANAGIYGIHLQYKMIDECGNTTFNSAQASLQNS